MDSHAIDDVNAQLASLRTIILARCVVPEAPGTRLPISEDWKKQIKDNFLELIVDPEDCTKEQKAYLDRVRHHIDRDVEVAFAMMELRILERERKQ